MQREMELIEDLCAGEEGDGRWGHDLSIRALSIECMIPHKFAVAFSIYDVGHAVVFVILRFVSNPIITK